MYRIEAHVPTTRRQAMCYVMTSDNVLAFSHRHVDVCLQWVWDQGQGRVEVIGPNYAAWIAIESVQASS